MNTHQWISCSRKFSVPDSISQVRKSIRSSNFRISPTCYCNLGYQPTLSIATNFVSDTPCSIPNSAANVCMLDVFSQSFLRSQLACIGWVLHLCNPLTLSSWPCMSSKSSAATACRFPISTLELLLGTSGLLDRPNDIAKTTDESTLTLALKLTLELGIFAKKISTIFRRKPRL